MADPTFLNPAASGNVAKDIYFQTGDPFKGLPAGPLGLILLQLKIITLLLRQGFNLNDEDLSILAQQPQTLNPPSSLPNI